jgi:small subunit ribosomal protein S21
MRPMREASTVCARRFLGATRVQVFVRDNDVEQALRILKRKMQREGVFREMRRRRHYEKPSDRTSREKAEAIRRLRKLARKQAIRDGLIAAPCEEACRQRQERDRIACQCRWTAARLADPALKSDMSWVAWVTALMLSIVVSCSVTDAPPAYDKPGSVPSS